MIYDTRKDRPTGKKKKCMMRGVAIIISPDFKEASLYIVKNIVEIIKFVKRDVTKKAIIGACLTISVYILRLSWMQNKSGMKLQLDSNQLI